LTFTPPGVGLPGTNQFFLQQALLADGTIIPATALQLNSGVNIVGAPVGINIFGSGGGPVSLPAVAFPQKFASGYYRLIAVGFEVVNTTAELYKGGSVTVYKSPAYPQPCITRAGGANTAFGVPTFTTLCNLPPGVQTDAALFPTSRTWGAEDGCYVVPSLNSSDVPFVAPLTSAQAGLVLNGSVTTLTTGTGNRIVYLPLQALNSSAAVPVTSAQNSPFPFDISGAIFSGLNFNSTLQVTVKYVVERIPSITEPDLLVLARTPCPYDPMAVEIYTRAISMLPPGVKVGDNPDGEFWASILDAIAAIAPVIGGVLAPLTGPLGPALGAAGAALAGGGSAAVRANARRKAEKKSQGNNNSSKKS